MMSRAPDIEDLERMLNEGGDADSINNLAIEIYDRLREEAERAQYKADISNRNRILREAEDFLNVMKQISERKAPVFIERFVEHVKNK